VAVELATDFNAIFFDSRLSANLNAAVFNNFNQIDRYNFFKSHDIFLVSSLTIQSGIKVSSCPNWYGLAIDSARKPTKKLL
jgi:hypothetical protein